jgi:putative ATP-grasp target RiPP
MTPYVNVAEYPQYTVTIDPDTQTGRYLDSSGNVIDMRHRKTNRGTETEVTVQKGYCHP